MVEKPKTPPEIIINQWVFVQLYKTPDGQFPLIYQLGIRLYAATGSDNDKLALLSKLAAWDFHLASIFPIPESRGVHLGLSGDPRTPTLTGVVPIQTITSPEKQMALFGDALEAVRQLLPENSLTTTFKHTALEDLSLLYTFTQVDVDEDGKMTARTRIPDLSMSDPTVAVNLWAFPESDFQRVQALSGRAYLVSGDRNEVEAILANLCTADYLLASRNALPAPLPMTGHSSSLSSHPADFSALMAHEDAMFSFIDDRIQKEIPVKYTDCAKIKNHRYTLPTNRNVRRTSVVWADGTVDSLAR